MKPFQNHIKYFLCLLLLLAACRNNRRPDKMVFRYNQIDGIETLDPAFAKSLAIMWGTHFLYNTLLEVDSGLDIVPSLADSWEISEDGREYTFHLRTDVFFHDNDAFPGGKGRKMIASDVVYSFARLVNPSEATAGAWIFNDRIADDRPFEAKNDSTFILRLKEPFRPLPQILTMQYCSVIPKEVVGKWGKDFRNHPCGTGPFCFHYWDEGNTMVFYKNTHYWEKDEKGQSLPYLDAIEVSFHDTRMMEFLLFQQKKLDFMYKIDPSMKDMVMTRKGALRPAYERQMTLQKHSYLYTEYIGCLVNSEEPGLKDNPLALRKVRQAINYAIDRRKIVTYFRNGVGLPAVKGLGFIPAGLMKGRKTIVSGYDYNPVKALELLKEAGFENGKNLPLITLTAPDADVDICNFVASQLNEIGIKTEVQIMLKGLMRQMMTKNQLAFFKAGWVADYPDPESFMACFYSKFPSPPNYTRFKSADFDSWYEQSLKTNSDTSRFLLYAKMDSLVSAEAPVIPLYYDEIVNFTQKNIVGFQTNALNIIDLRRVKKN